MELLTEKQIAEMIVEQKNKNQEWVEKIKQELQSRKELKKKLEEAKQRQAGQLQVLERLDESEKMVRKELELVAKFEDSDSLKQLAIIKQYEDMLADQKKTWELYKEQYESLSSVKKVREAEAELLCSKIQLALKLQKMKDMKRMVQLRELVRKKQEQAKIIKLAEMYVQYKRREKRCRELWDENKKLTAQAQHLRQELQDREKAKQQKLSAELEKASELMKPQQLPQIDISNFIIHRDKRNDKLDTMSINSYILEEEYMNNNGQSISKLTSSQTKAMDVDNQDSMHMDIDTQGAGSQERERAQPNETSRRVDFKGAFGNETETQCTSPGAEHNNKEMQSHEQPGSSNQSHSQVDEHHRTYDQNMDSQESRTSHTNVNQHSAKKRASQKPQQSEEDATMHVSFANNENANNACSTPYDRPIPTPAKMTKKSAFQEKHPHFQQTPKQEIPQQHIYRQEMSQQNQNQQVSNRSSCDMQQQQQVQFQQLPKRSSQEMIQQQQQQQSSRNSSQESYQQQQQQMSREVHQQNQQQQTPRHPPQEMYQQNQQQRQPPQEVYQQNHQQQQSRHPSQEMYQPEQQSQHPPSGMYQQNQQSRHPSQEMYQQTPRQQETYLRNEQRQTPQQPIQVSLQNSEQMDFSRLPTNKPRIIANEHVNYNLQAMQRKQILETQPKAQPTPRTPMETPTAKSVAPSKSETTPFAYHAPFVTSSQTSVNVTPMSVEIHPSSMMSTTMHSTDSNYLLPDNISAILGSEVTEPGGSFELARRLHDTDSISDIADIDDYDAMMKKLGSPIHTISPKAQQPQAPANASTQPPANNSIIQNTQDSNANSNDQVFSFGGYARKPTHKFF